jgi:peptidoglycan/LPS O-acetylase OafA/YrhL
MSSTESKRANGLDTLRAAAIILVFMYHYKVFVSHEDTFGWLSTIGWAGVDLFFVLSGYLIGNQLFVGLVQGQQLSLKNFYARRALRTWPVYWVVLAAYFLLPTLMGGKQPPPLWQFLTFTQNIGLMPGTAFSHAWSLCIEEQFYLVLPLIVLLALRVGSHRGQAWLLLAALMLIGITIRIVRWQSYGPIASGNTTGYYPNIYYATLCRFDEFLPGIAVALLKNFYPQQWQRLIVHGQRTLWIGLIAVAVLLYVAYHTLYIEGYGAGFFMTAFGYSLLAVAFAILVMAALSPTSWLHRVRVPGAYHIAIWSYSIYLSHKAVAYIIASYAVRMQWSAASLLIVVSIASVLVGVALYRFVETPFMNIRQRFFPNTFSSAPLRLSGQVRSI